MKTHKTRRGTLRTALEDLGPLVKSLRQLERDLSVIDLQIESIPRDCEGPRPLLDKCQRAADVRFKRLVGKAAFGEWMSAADVRRILSAIESLAEASGAKLDTARLPLNAIAWTSRENIYEGIAPGESREVAGSKYRLAVRLRLKPDGSLARPLPEIEAEEE